MLISILLIILTFSLMHLVTIRSIDYPSPYEEKISVKRGFAYAGTTIFTTIMYFIAQSNLFDGFVEAFYYTMLFGALYALAWVDYCYGILPNKINLVAFVIAIIVAILEVVYDFSTLIQVSGEQRIWAVVSLLVFVLILKIFRAEEKIGGGDIKLLFWLGIALGVKYLVVGFVIASLVLIVFSLILSAIKRSYISKMKFGPALAIGYISAIFCGDVLFESYLKLAGF